MQKRLCRCGYDITRSDYVVRKNNVLYIHAQIGCFYFDPNKRTRPKPIIAGAAGLALLGLIGSSL